MNSKADFKSDFLREFCARGFFAQTTHANELDEAFSSEKITAYIGFDCTAKSLHAGSLIQIMILRLLQKYGHKPIVLLGGGTTRIGDPSGKDEARQILDEAQIAQNLSGIRKTLEKFISFGGGASNAILVNNDDWLRHLNYIDFLREIGRHFSINRMLSFDSVKTRLEREQPLSFLEFNYMILQAYDFFELNRKYNCRLQIGGSDQWGNIVNGVKLTRKKRIFEFLEKISKNSEQKAQIEHLINAYNKFDEKEDYNTSTTFAYGAATTAEELHNDNIDRFSQTNELKSIIKSSSVFGLTSPLLTTADGKKMGKTADGAIWLDSSMLSPFDYFQYFRNTHDADVGKFLKLFTDLELGEIAKLEALQGVEINKAKEVLAFQATKICHGEAAANDALTKAREIFISKNSNAFEEKEISLGVEKSKKLTDIIFEIGAAESKGAAKKLIEGKAVKINGEAAADINHTFTQTGDFELSVGKKKFFKIIIK